MRTVTRERATPPRALSEDEIRETAGDYHGPASEHRKNFSDGRVGSFSELADHEHGGQLVTAAANALTEEFRAFVAE